MKTLDDAIRVGLADISRDIARARPNIQPPMERQVAVMAKHLRSWLEAATDDPGDVMVMDAINPSKYRLIRADAIGESNANA